jgi:hypothetical protein
MDASGCWAALQCAAHPGFRNGNAMSAPALAAGFIVRTLSDLSGKRGHSPFSQQSGIRGAL